MKVSGSSESPNHRIAFCTQLPHINSYFRGYYDAFSCRSCEPEKIFRRSLIDRRSKFLLTTGRYCRRRGTKWCVQSYREAKEIHFVCFCVPHTKLIFLNLLGAGKSTLIKMLIGKEQPDSGSITIGDTVSSGYLG